MPFKEVYIHAGMNKTASTFLQNEIFRRLGSDFIYVDTNTSISSALLKNYLPKSDKLLISDESLLGVPIMPPGLDRVKQRRIVLQNIFKIFPNARFILGFRRQSEFLLSLYKQYLHVGGTLVISDFFDIKKDKGYIKQEDLFFSERLEFILDNFPNKPFLFDFEKFKNEKQEVIYNLLKYLENENIDYNENATYNSGVKHYQSRLLRYLNIISKSELNPKGYLKLHDPSFKKRKLDPRSICQTRLKKLSNRNLKLPDNIRDFIEHEYSQDWKNISTHMYNFASSFSHS